MSRSLNLPNPIAIMCAVVGLSIAGCATSQPAKSANGTVSRRDPNGLPVWNSKPRDGLPSGMIAGIGRSSMADMDVEMAKREAETLARNQLAMELESNIQSTVSFR